MGLKFQSYNKNTCILTLIEGLFMLPAVAAGLYYEKWKAAGSLFTISLICISVGFVILTQFRFDKIALRSREGFFIAFASWIYCSLWGLFRCTYPV